MGLCAINGIAVTRARFTMPRQGCWVADLLAVEQVEGGKVTITNEDGLTLVGTTERSGAFEETGYLRVAPGANGLKRPSKSKHYRNASIGVVAKDLLSAAGETLSPTSTSSLLSVQLSSYTLMRDAVGRSLSALLADRRLLRSDATTGLATPTMLAPPNPGLAVPGNIDLTSRPRVKNADGSISTVRSMSFGSDGYEVLIPTVSDAGKLLTDDQAIALYFKTGKHLGKFTSVAAAEAYAERLHNQQAAGLAVPPVGPTWRALPDGTIFLGYETWPAANLELPVDYQDINELPHEGRAELGFEAPLLLPGQSLGGRHVSAVEHNLDGETVRTAAWFED